MQNVSHFVKHIFTLIVISSGKKIFSDFNFATYLISANGNMAGKANAKVNMIKGSTSSSPPIRESSPVEIEAEISFKQGDRLEVQNFNGFWHPAHILEVDNDEHEVLIRLENSHRTEFTRMGAEEWIPMNCKRLRKKAPRNLMRELELEENCTEHLPEPCESPNAVNKVVGIVPKISNEEFGPTEVELPAPPAGITPSHSFSNLMPVTPVQSGKWSYPVSVSGSNKSTSIVSSADWPLSDYSKFNLSSLNLPDIPRDGEWSCHWVNDKPIGREGALVINKEIKPTVIVEDWRLPPNWVKHMHPRSNDMTKWAVILVAPNGKHFRSKTNLKLFLEEQGEAYNADIFDFSIHRSRAMEINAYIYTSYSTPNQSQNSIQFDPTTDAMDSVEIQTSTTAAESFPEYFSGVKCDTNDINSSKDNSKIVSTIFAADSIPIENVNGKNVENLFSCPQEGCFKHFRKKDHLQAHFKHYHQDVKTLCKSKRKRTTRRHNKKTRATSSNNFGVMSVAKIAKKRKLSRPPGTLSSCSDSVTTAEISLQAVLSTDAKNGSNSESENIEKVDNLKLDSIMEKLLWENDIINCHCSFGKTNGLMIQCELCLCWQHGKCNSIETEAEVPDKYICFSCRNPRRPRESLRYKHDQDWLNDGKLPVANYHMPNPNLPERFGFLKQTHILAGDLIELKHFSHSLRVKMDIANNPQHPKLYLWAEKWEKDNKDAKLCKFDLNPTECIDRKDTGNIALDPTEKFIGGDGNGAASTEKIELGSTELIHPTPKIPQPEVLIDPIECQQRLMEHVAVQQNLVLGRLNSIEAEIDELEQRQGDLNDFNDCDMKSILSTFIKELNVLNQIAKLNALEHAKQVPK